MPDHYLAVICHPSVVQVRMVMTKSNFQIFRCWRLVFCCSMLDPWSASADSVKMWNERSCPLPSGGFGVLQPEPQPCEEKRDFRNHLRSLTRSMGG